MADIRLLERTLASEFQSGVAVGLTREFYEYESRTVTVQVGVVESCGMSPSRASPLSVARHTSARNPSTSRPC
jgi:hypothetical protein